MCIYTLGKGRVADAEKSLCWLRGWVKPDAVQYELSMLSKSIALNEEKVRMKQNKKFYSFYMKRTFLLPYFIITSAFFFGNFGGMSTLQVNAVSLNNEGIFDFSPINLFNNLLMNRFKFLKLWDLQLMVIHLH